MFEKALECRKQNDRSKPSRWSRATGRLLGKISYKVFLIGGLVLVAGSLLVLLLIYYPVLALEVNYFFSGGDRARPASSITEVSQGSPLPPLDITPVDSWFGVIIPKIGVNSKVLPNINQFNKEEYLAALKKGVAHTLGTAFPGEPGNVFLFSHSTDLASNVSQYNAIFYLLTKLEPGDEIDVFYQGQRHYYRMTEKKIVEPTDLSYLNWKPSEKMLTLMTCWPPGTTLQRMLVIAKEVE